MSSWAQLSRRVLNGRCATALRVQLAGAGAFLVGSLCQFPFTEDRGANLASTMSSWRDSRILRRSFVAILAKQRCPSAPLTVIAMGHSFQMIWAYTRSNAASMIGFFPLWQRSLERHKTERVSLRNASLPIIDLTVALDADRSQPQPTSAIRLRYRVVKNGLLCALGMHSGSLYLLEAV